jgi:hypothetical protein
MVVVIFSIGCFYETTFNILAWQETTRLICAIAYGTISAICFMMGLMILLPTPNSENDASQKIQTELPDDDL